MGNHAHNGQLLHFWLIIFRYSKTRRYTFAYTYAYIDDCSNALSRTCPHCDCTWAFVAVKTRLWLAIFHLKTMLNQSMTVTFQNRKWKPLSLKVPWLLIHAFLDALGVGDHIHNFVYRFAPWHDLGCWRDTGDGRTMTLLANFRGRIDWFHMEKTGNYE